MPCSALCSVTHTSYTTIGGRRGSSGWVGCCSHLAMSPVAYSLDAPLSPQTMRQRRPPTRSSPCEKDTISSWPLSNHPPILSCHDYACSPSFAVTFSEPLSATDTLIDPSSAIAPTSITSLFLWWETASQGPLTVSGLCLDSGRGYRGRSQTDSQMLDAFPEQRSVIREPGR